MSSRLEVDKHQAALAAQRETTYATYKKFIASKPFLCDCDANEAMFRGYMDFDDELLAADFEFALSNFPEGSLATQRVLTPQQVVDAENAHRKKLSLPALHELSRRERPAPTRGSLPTTWYNADISTPAALRTLAKNNLQSFKALVERYGEEVNKALGVVRKPQSGSLRIKI